MKFKKIVAGVLGAAMIASLAACGNNTATPTASGNTTGTPTPTTAASTEKRTADVIIGTWWVQHYDSNDDELTDSPDYETAIDKENSTEEEKAMNAINRDVAQRKFNKVKEIEEKYGLKFYWENLTYAGVQESINTSILGGSPDADIYLVDAGMAIPAQMNNLCIDLKTILPADHDLFTDQIVATYLDLDDGRACILRKVGGMNNSGALAYNKQLLEANNLEDPLVLYEKGEWDWDTFLDYCKKLTQDTDGDGQIDQYGLGGYYPDIFEKLMLSNGADIAKTSTQHLTSAKMTEVLQFIQTLYIDEKVCEPANSEDDANKARTSYRSGKIGFFYLDCWIEQTDGSDYDWDGSLGYTLPFDIVYGHWPVGYSGDQDTDPQMNNVGGELYIIPAGVQDPLTVFNVLYDMWNWYDSDISLRDNPALNHWWSECTGKADAMYDATTPIRDRNFKTQTEILAKQTVDLWNSIGVSFDLWSLISTEDTGVTASQWQETYKQSFQDALDQYFK